ncbi:YihY/virulence factor BrkB family protein [Oxalobacteraceae bacterium R-40]|uniref:YihY/virulence factor BrkB family protein n=1 Tax=Keguizhuia sedimenti TaxID=3064264 RepID=A0ABU1BMP0_9BURK|nr:YihY/virulence factor BrkB family protein [Oxalobacteraceae bacterium R-40]
MNLKNICILIKAATSSWVDDYAQSMGAALAYYTMFSVAPLLLIVISAAGLVFGEEAARGEIFAQLQELMGEQGAGAVQGLLESVNKPAENFTAMLIGSALLLVGATTVFGELQDALDRIWRAPKRNKSGIWNLLRARLLSFGMIMGVGFLLMVSLVVSAGLAAVGKLLGTSLADWVILASVINFLLGFAFTTVVFAMIYKTMPRARVDWTDVWIGAAVTSLLFAVGKLLIGLYIGKSGVTSAFGAAGSLVVVLVWVYYSAQIFLMGAEFTWAYAVTFGSRKEESMPSAAPVIPSQSSGKQPDQNLIDAKKAAAEQEVLNQSEKDPTSD